VAWNGLAESATTPTQEKQVYREGRASQARKYDKKEDLQTFFQR
jgi:hypothetical protein